MSEINLPPFYVGQKVVCIRGYENEPSLHRGRPHPITGKEYTFRGADSSGYIGGIYLKEIISENFMGHELSFLTTRFSPIQENFQSITLEKVLEEETKLISTN